MTHGQNMIPNYDATAVNDITIILHLGIAWTSDSGIVTTKGTLVNHRVPLNEPAEQQRLETRKSISNYRGNTMILFNVVYMHSTYEPRHDISNNVVYAISKCSDQPAHTRGLIRAFASRLNVL